MNEEIEKNINQIASLIGDHKVEPNEEVLMTLAKLKTTIIKRNKLVDFERLIIISGKEGDRLSATDVCMRLGIDTKHVRKVGMALTARFGKRVSTKTKSGNQYLYVIK